MFTSKGDYGQNGLLGKNQRGAGQSASFSDLAHPIDYV